MEPSTIGILVLLVLLLLAILTIVIMALLFPTCKDCKSKEQISANCPTFCASDEQIAENCPKCQTCPTCPTCPPNGDCPTCPTCPTDGTCPTCPPNGDCPKYPEFGECSSCENCKWVTTTKPTDDKQIKNKFIYQTTAPISGKLTAIDVYATGWLGNGFAHFNSNINGTNIYDGSFNHSQSTVEKKRIEFDNIPIKKGDRIYVDWSTVGAARDLKVKMDWNNIPYLEFFVNSC